MRVRLRWKIMTFTVLPLVTLAFATLWIVNHGFTSQVHQGIHDDLRRASAVLEDLMAARSQALVVAGEMTVQDPKFFSVLTIPGSYQEPQLRATVMGVAKDFNAITKSDLFEVTDRAGHLVAAVGRDTSVAAGREALVRDALAGRPVSGILVQPHAHYQVSVTPVIAGGRVVGTLLLGARIGGELAERLRRLTRSEVTFVSRGASTGSTLESTEDRDAALAAVTRLEHRPKSNAGSETSLEVKGGSHLYVTLIHALSDPRLEQRQFYVMQRAIDAETVFLREVQGHLLSLGISAILVALLAGFLIAERITAPVQRLVRGAEEIKHGNYDFPLAIRSRDEIGDLASCFDDMRKQQREYVHSLTEVARVKSEFINVASHELRTPLTVIRGFQELLLDGALGALNPQQSHAIEAVNRSVGTLTRIAEDATRMSQIDAERLPIERSNCDVARLVERAIASARASAQGRRVQIEFEATADLGMLHVDGPSVVQALANLVANGIRFTPDGGRVTVRAARKGGWLAISVADTGIGIEPGRKEKIFEPSFAGDSRHHHSSTTLEFNSAGLGLGLPIARGIVEAHGGRIELVSTPGAGTTVTMRFPISSAGAAEPEFLKEAA